MENCWIVSSSRRLPAAWTTWPLLRRGSPAGLPSANDPARRQPARARPPRATPLEAELRPTRGASPPLFPGAEIMVSCRPQWTAGFLAILMTVLGGSLGAQDRSTEDVLKSHGLKRVGTAYV